MKRMPIRRSAVGNENPRSITPFTTLNCVVTAQMPSASTSTASAQKPFSLIKTRNPTRVSWRRESKSMGEDGEDGEDAEDLGDGEDAEDLGDGEDAEDLEDWGDWGGLGDGGDWRSCVLI